MDRLDGRTILVTGAALGIGGAAAIACARQGATVILLDKRMKDLEMVYDRLEASGAPEPALYPLDLLGATPQDYQDLADRLAENFERLDGLLHCAAYLGVLSRIDDYDAEAWYRNIQINLTAPFLLTQACLPLLRRAPDASILFLSDRVGRRSRAYWGAYAAAKAGVENLAETLADELRGSSEIRVNTLDPGPTRTSLRAAAYPGEDPGSLKGPDEVAPLIVWAMGPGSLGMSGNAWDFDDAPHRSKENFES
ncbi:MAG: YciK family oxidoreductase [Pseudomonadota bacterium]